MSIELNPRFNVECWPELEALYREQIAQGVLQWTLDFHHFLVINGRLLGLVIGLNTILSSRKGSLKLIVRKQSPLADLINQARLSKILTVEEI